MENILDNEELFFLMKKIYMERTFDQVSLYILSGGTLCPGILRALYKPNFAFNAKIEEFRPKEKHQILFLTKEACSKIREINKEDFDNWHLEAERNIRNKINRIISIFCKNFIYPRSSLKAGNTKAIAIISNRHDNIFPQRLSVFCLSSELLFFSIFIILNIIFGNYNKN